MNIRKLVFILLLLAIISGGSYYVYQQFFGNTPTDDMAAVGGTVSTVTKGRLDDGIDVTGKAELANEQKLRFGQNGKIAEIYTKVGDTVEKDQVLASLDKREFFQELAQAQNRLNKTNREIKEQREKAHGTEARRMEREIAAMERKLEEMQENLEKAVQNSPGKSQEKLLDLNAKKRDLAAQKEKYKIDKSNYEKEFSKKDELIKSKTEEGQKLVESIIQSSSTELSEMRQLYKEFNRLFGFDFNEISYQDQFYATYLSNNNRSLRSQLENLWKELRDDIRNYEKIATGLKYNSQNPDDAEGLTNELLRVYKKLLEAADVARRAADATEVYENSSFTRSDLNKILGDIGTIRNTITGKIETHTKNRDSLLLVDNPEKIKEKFLTDLQTKKFALETAEDAIRRLEIQISQSEKDIKIISDNVVQDDSLRREIADKQSAIQDQKDSILTKKEDLAKLKSGKNDTLENLLTTKKDQEAEMEKLRTKEETYEIRAPFAGTIRAIKFKTGDVLGKSDGNADADKVILLENSEIINVKVGLNQLDIVKVKMKQKATITFEAVPDAKLEGTITEISSTPSDSSGSGLPTYNVIISAERGSHPIYSGMNAAVNISLGSSEETLLVPLTAVSQDPATGDSYVNVVSKDGSKTKTKVTTGKSAKGQIQILSGLEEGQVVETIDFAGNTFDGGNFEISYF